MKFPLVVVCLICSLTAWGQGQGMSALDDLIRSAEQGDADAQLSLGGMYDNGEGVPQDYVQAVKWYRLAAEQGNAMAQGILGNMYYRGQGVPQDYTQAVKWYRLAVVSQFDYYGGLVYECPDERGNSSNHRCD